MRKSKTQSFHNPFFSLDSGSRVHSRERNQIKSYVCFPNKLYVRCFTRDPESTHRNTKEKTRRRPRTLLQYVVYSQKCGANVLIYAYLFNRRHFMTEHLVRYNAENSLHAMDMDPQIPYFELWFTLIRSRSSIVTPQKESASLAIGLWNLKNILSRYFHPTLFSAVLRP